MGKILNSPKGVKSGVQIQNMNKISFFSYLGGGGGPGGPIRQTQGYQFVMQL